MSKRSIFVSADRRLNEMMAVPIQKAAKAKIVI